MRFPRLGHPTGAFFERARYRYGSDRKGLTKRLRVR